MSAGIGGPLGTAGKLISDLGQNLEAPRLQMSHRPLRRLLYPASWHRRIRTPRLSWLELYPSVQAHLIGADRRRRRRDTRWRRSFWRVCGSASQCVWRLWDFAAPPRSIADKAVV